MLAFEGNPNQMMRRIVSTTDWIGTSLTEQVNPATAQIDTLSTRAMVAAIAAEDASVPAAVAAVGDDIARLVDVVVESTLR